MLSSHKHAATGFREELEECKDKISGLDDKIKLLDEEIEGEKAKAQAAQEVLTKIDEVKENLQYKQSDSETQEAGETQKASLH